MIYKDPKVSVILPTYNRANYIARALDSILVQTYKDYEIIVVDDGSTDATSEVLKHFSDKIKYIRQSNQGSATARNRGIQESKGEYIAFLDSDDYWVPEKLQEQVNVLAVHPEVGIVYARMPIINEKGEKIGMKPAGVSGKNFKELLEVWGDLPTSTVMTRRVCFNEVGLFDTTLVTMQDIDMWLRISRRYQLYEIEGKVLAYYCRHNTQITTNKIKVYSGLVTIYKKILRSYPDAPRELMLKRILSNQYLLARANYNERFYSAALKNALAVVGRNPLVGQLFFGQEDNAIQKLFKLIKPYALLAVCFLRWCGQGFKRTAERQGTGS